MPTAEALPFPLIRSPSHWAGTPVSWHLTFFDLGWAQMNTDHIGDLTTPIDLPAARLARGFTLSQTMDQLLTQSTYWKRVNGVVDRFAADVGVSKIRDCHILELAGDLFRRQALTQHMNHQAKALATVGHDISSATFCKWRSGSIDASFMTRNKN